MRMIKTTLAVLTLCAGLLVLTSAITLVRHNPGVFNSGISRYTVDLSRFDAAPLIAFTATKETDYGTETNRRI